MRIALPRHSWLVTWPKVPQECRCAMQPRNSGPKDTASSSLAAKSLLPRSREAGTCTRHSDKGLAAGWLGWAGPSTHQQAAECREYCTAIINSELARRQKVAARVAAAKGKMDNRKLSPILSPEIEELLANLQQEVPFFGRTRLNWKLEQVFVRQFD